MLALGLVSLGVLCGPGALLLWAVERTKPRWVRGWSAGEKLLAVMGVSLVVCYAVGIAVAWARCFEAQQVIAWAGVACLAPGLGTLRSLLRSSSAREALKVTLVVAVGLSAMMALPYYFGGGKWAGDWLEHLERAAYFRGLVGDQFRFQNLYVLSARPPLQNVIVALLMSVAGGGNGGGIQAIRVDQWGCVVLAIPTVLTLMILSRSFGLTRSRRGVAGRWLMAALLLGSPMFCAHLLFLWTRILTSFFLLAGLYFYARALSRRDQGRAMVAMGLLSAGMLTHYSAGPFLAGVGVHLLTVGGRRFASDGRTVRGVLLCLLVPVAVLLSWWGPAVARFGVAEVFTSTSAVSDTGQLTLWQNGLKIAYNLFTSFVPHPVYLSRQAFDSYFAQRSGIGWWRDYVFHIDVTTLPGMMGPIMGVPAAVAVWRRLRSAGGAVRGFWIFMTVWGVGVGIAVHGEPDDFGAAHICLMPLALLALATLAAELPQMAPGWRITVLLGLLLSWAVSICPAIYCLSAVGGPEASLQRRDWALSWHAYEQFARLRRLTQLSIGSWLADWREALVLVWVGVSAAVYVLSWRRTMRRVALSGDESALSSPGSASP